MFVENTETFITKISTRLSHTICTPEHQSPAVALVWRAELHHKRIEDFHTFNYLPVL